MYKRQDRERLIAEFLEKDIDKVMNVGADMQSSRNSVELAGKYQVSPAQLCLRFLLQNDIIPLPRSSSMERMKQNMDLFHFEISEEDVSRLATMPQAGWSGEHPDPELAQKNVV